MEVLFLLLAAQPSLYIALLSISPCAVTALELIGAVKVPEVEEEEDEEEDSEEDESATSSTAAHLQH